jgi:hypothetical protein
MISRALPSQKLAEFFFVITNVVFSDERDEVCGRVACKRGFAEIRIGRYNFRARVCVREIAAPAAGDSDFLPTLPACSSTSTLRPRLPASIAHINPAAPAPIITTSIFIAGV